MRTASLKIPILSVSLLTIMASAAVSPALPAIASAFPNVDQTTIKLIITLPSLVIVPFSLLSGWLAARFRVKAILATGLVAYLVGGIGAGLMSSIGGVLAMRVLLGVGVGLIMPLSNTLIFEYFSGEQRTKMVGLAGSVNQLGGMIFLSVSGVLACYSWRYSFFVYALAVLSLVLTSIWLPEPERKQAVKSTGVKVRLPRTVFGLAALGSLMMMVFFVVTTDLALFIQRDRALFSSPVKLTQSREALRGQLAKGVVGVEIAKAFARQKITIAPTAKLKEVTPRQVWSISDGTREYTVAKKDGKLIVFSGLGTSALAGLALSVLTLSGALAGFILNTLLKRLGNYLMPAAGVTMGVGYGILAMSYSAAPVFAAMFFIGLAGGLMSPPIMLKISQVVTPQARTLAVAVVSSAILFGQFLSPLLMKMVTVITGQDSSRFHFYSMAVLLLAASIIGVITLVCIPKPKRIASPSAIGQV
ncbi:MAG: MFS transporter [Armatimonadota bacterium]|nr:MFS transporter [bacterium]